jgi:hypothetical protein
MRAVTLLAAAVAALAAGAVQAQPAPAVAHDQAAVVAVTERYFSALDRGDWRAAYDFYTPGAVQASFQEWRDSRRAFASQAGVAEGRRVVKVTWYDNPPDAPRAGTYAAVDYTGAYEKMALECGYVVWFHDGAAGWRLVRQEQNLIPRDQAAAMSPEQLAEVKREFHCAE